MRTILAALAGGLLIGAAAVSYAELPPPTPQEKAAAAAKAQKAESEKAKAAKEVDRAQDRAVASYRKNRGKSSSSAGATAQPEMPKPGQVNDYSTPERDPQNSSRDARSPDRG